MNPEQPIQNNNPTQQTSAQPQGPEVSDIAQKAAQKRGRLFDPTGKIEALTTDEVLVADVRRHPFGLFLIYLQLFFGLGLGLILIGILLPTVAEVIGIDQTVINAVASLAGLGIIVLGLIFLFLATRIYKGNQLIISDKNVTQVLQIGLFDRKISELSMAKVEDVTAQQRGIFPTLLNYGTLHIETAGEQNNFIFIYCPNPNAYAKAILDARVEFITHKTTVH